MTIEIISNEQQVDFLSIGSNMSKESTRKRKIIDFKNNCLFNLSFYSRKSYNWGYTRKIILLSEHFIKHFISYF